MNQTQWERAEELFLAGLEMDARAREAYWRHACGADRSLLAEVHQLWEGQQRAEKINFLDKAAWTLAGKPSLTGRQIGPYEIRQRIGSGGMGDVYLAFERQPHYSREVVLKLVKDQLDADDRQRFLDEIRILARLEHENIARMYSGGSEDGQLYLAMEYLRDGVSLRDYLKAVEGKILPLTTVAEITRQVCAGFGAAHGRGVVHRDIKPENIMIIQSPEGLRAKVIDFGLAIPLEAGNAITLPRRLPTKGFRGTPHYMSPEQAAGKTRAEIDERSDIYSLGLVIYEMLTGALAFDGSLGELFRKHVEEYPTPPQSLNPKLNNAVNRVVMKALAKDPSARQQSMSELARELSAAAVEIKRDRRWLALAASLAILLGGWLGYARLTSPEAAPAHNATPVSVAPAPAASVLLPLNLEPKPPAPTTATTTAGPLKLAVYQQGQGDQMLPVAANTVFQNSQRGQKRGGVRIAAQAAADGYLYILEEGDDGQLNILYPHPRNPGSGRLIAAGQQIFLPNEREWFRFNGAAGTDAVYVLFARSKDERLFTPIVEAVSKRRAAITPEHAAAVLTPLRERAAALENTVQGLQQWITGAGPLVGVLKLQHIP